MEEGFSADSIKSLSSIYIIIYSNTSFSKKKHEESITRAYETNTWFIVLGSSLFDKTWLHWLKFHKISDRKNKLGLTSLFRFADFQTQISICFIALSWTFISPVTIYI